MFTPTHRQIMQAEFEYCLPRGSQFYVGLVGCSLSSLDHNFASCWTTMSLHMVLYPCRSYSVNKCPKLCKYNVDTHPCKQKLHNRRVKKRILPAQTTPEKSHAPEILLEGQGRFLTPRKRKFCLHRGTYPQNEFYFCTLCHSTIMQRYFVVSQLVQPVLLRMQHLEGRHSMSAGWPVINAV